MNWELIMLHESFGFTLLHSLAVDLFFSFLFCCHIFYLKRYLLRPSGPLMEHYQLHMTSKASSFREK